MTVLNKDRILTVAVQQITLHGLRRLSLADLARELGVVKSALYHYFAGGKAELIDAAFEREETRMLADLEAAVASETGSHAKLLAFVKARYQFVHDLARLYQVSEAVLDEIGGYRFSRRQEYFKREHAILSTLLKAGVKAKELCLIDPALVACAIQGAMAQISRAYVFQTERDAVSDLEALVRLILDGIIFRGEEECAKAGTVEI